MPLALWANAKYALRHGGRVGVPAGTRSRRRTRAREGRRLMAARSGAIGGRSGSAAGARRRRTGSLRRHWRRFEAAGIVLAAGRSGAGGGDRGDRLPRTATRARPTTGRRSSARSARAGGGRSPSTCPTSARRSPRAGFDHSVARLRGLRRRGAGGARGRARRARDPRLRRADRPCLGDGQRRAPRLGDRDQHRHPPRLQVAPAGADLADAGARRGLHGDRDARRLPSPGRRGRAARSPPPLPRPHVRPVRPADQTRGAGALPGDRRSRGVAAGLAAALRGARSRRW